ncbi:protogenin A-like isoform X2 [Anneissia japonica]|nr:protogenin A-like isoform X2 [Anneissia japonica]
MTYTLTLEPGDDFSFLAWFKSNENGVEGESIITNITGNPQPSGRYSLSDNGSLIISNVEVEDAGYYLFRVVTTNSDMAENVSDLTVYYLDAPTLMPKEKSVIINTTATFLCPLPDGVPTPIIITWIKNGGVLNVSDTEKYPQSDTTLEISGVNEMDEGDYQCQTENSAYSGDEGKLSNTGTLSLFRPTFPSTTSIASSFSVGRSSLHSYFLYVRLFANE